jgi:hypothetical protein
VGTACGDEMGGVLKILNVADVCLFALFFVVREREKKLISFVQWNQPDIADWNRMGETLKGLVGNRSSVLGSDR